MVLHIMDMFRDAISTTRWQYEAWIRVEALWSDKPWHRLILIPDADLVSQYGWSIPYDVKSICRRWHHSKGMVELQNKKCGWVHISTDLKIIYKKDTFVQCMKRGYARQAILTAALMIIKAFMNIICRWLNDYWRLWDPCYLHPKGLKHLQDR